MTPERYARIGELFDAALELPQDERPAFLREACGGVESLYEDVVRLLATHERATDFLSPSAGTEGQTVQQSIGPYRIRRQLGEGGMGTVYLAEQTEPIRREVALKVIKPGMGSKAIVARFEIERRALALMDHPNIAQVFDAGATIQGLPYFVMEYVEGPPITRYCEEQNLSVRQRIELFIPVCQAIHHAHQKGMIHRDIKPSNVLVKTVEGQAIPKVIDFGLAKALQPELAGETMMTNAGMVLGTLQYMSPEQAAPGMSDIDTRSDVYSLGALLYELLTGAPPLDVNQGARESHFRLLERVRTEEPAPPSVRRRESAMGPAGPLDRELDWIPLKALEKERDRRYGSVNGLVRDLERYLAGEPVDAAPPSQGYRVRKFVRRHRVSFGVAAAFLMVLVAAVAVSISMAVRARQAEQEASAMNAFLTRDVLAQADPRNQAKPNVPSDASLTVRTTLDRAASTVSGKFARQPLVEASIRETIASAYQGLGLFPKAEEQARQAMEIRRRVLGDHHRLTLRSRYLLALLVSVQGRYQDATPLFASLLADRRQNLGPMDPDTLESRVALARAYFLEGKFDAAANEYRQVMPLQVRMLGADHPATLDTVEAFASNYFSQRKLKDAEAMQVKLVEDRKRVLGEEHPDTVRSMTALAATYHLQIRRAEAEAMYRRALAIQRRIYGVAHPDTLVTMYNLATLLASMKQYPEALALYEENRAARGAVYPPEHPRTLRLLSNLASLYGNLGRTEDQKRMLEKVLAARRRVLGSSHPDTFESMLDLADLSSEAQPERAEALAREAYQGMRERMGLTYPDTTWALGTLVDLLLKRKQTAEAERLVRESLAAPQETMERLRLQIILGATLAEKPGHSEEAERLLVQSYQALLTQPWNEDFDIRRASRSLAKLSRARGDRSTAAEWLRRADAEIQHHQEQGK